MDDDSRQEGVELPSELEFGDETGDHRENDPGSPGYTPEDDRVFRSHFQRANRLADRAYEQVRPAYALGRDAARDPERGARSFEEVESDLQEGWMSTRTAAGDWASVRDFAREGFERGRALGFVQADSVIGTTPSHDRPSYRDPVPGNVDPTDPQNPEQTLDWQHGSDLGAMPPAKEDRSREPADMPSEAEKRVQ